MVRRIINILCTFFIFNFLAKVNANDLVQELNDTRLITAGNALGRASFCVDTYPGYDAWFRFLGKTAEMYLHAEAGFIYFEYYFPQFHWMGVTVSNQTNNVDVGCLQCVFTVGNDLIRDCLDECIGDSEFVVTGTTDLRDEEATVENWDIRDLDLFKNGTVSCVLCICVYSIVF